MVCTLAAEGPFGPSCASYWTFAPSSSDLKPLPAIAEWWTNRSLPWSSGVMKPKPLSLLNHLTVPVGMSIPPVFVLRDAEDAMVQLLRTANTAFIAGRLSGRLRMLVQVAASRHTCGERVIRRLVDEDER